jgi:chromosome segregation ATPase
LSEPLKYELRIARDKNIQQNDSIETLSKDYEQMEADYLSLNKRMNHSNKMTGRITSMNERLQNELSSTSEKLQQTNKVLIHRNNEISTIKIMMYDNRSIMEGLDTTQSSLIEELKCNIFNLNTEVIEKDTLIEHSNQQVLTHDIQNLDLSANLSTQINEKDNAIEQLNELLSTEKEINNNLNIVLLRIKDDNKQLTQLMLNYQSQTTNNNGDNLLIQLSSQKAISRALRKKLHDHSLDNTDFLSFIQHNMTLHAYFTMVEKITDKVST